MRAVIVLCLSGLIVYFMPMGDEFDDVVVEWSATAGRGLPDSGFWFVFSVKMAATVFVVSLLMPVGEMAWRAMGFGRPRPIRLDKQRIEMAGRQRL